MISNQSKRFADRLVALIHVGVGCRGFWITDKKQFDQINESKSLASVHHISRSKEGSVKDLCRVDGQYP